MFIQNPFLIYHVIRIFFGGNVIGSFNLVTNKKTWKLKICNSSKYIWKINEKLTKNDFKNRKIVWKINKNFYTISK